MYSVCPTLGKGRKERILWLPSASPSTVRGLGLNRGVEVCYAVLVRMRPCLSSVHHPQGGLMLWKKLKSFWTGFPLDWLKCFILSLSPCVFDSSARDAKAIGSLWVQGQAQLHCEFQYNQTCIIESLSQINKQKITSILQDLKCNVKWYSP